MQQAEPSARLIARNTLMLYLRTLLSVVVGLYVSRVVLRTLGAEDYGIYGLVGGIVSVFGFLNLSLAGATSRFITYDMGLGDTDQMKQTFNAAFQSHLIIAFIIVFLAETIGLWFVNHQLDIPQNRYFAANFIYQLSIFSAFIGITQAPYTALILAHEQMDVYAWLEVLNTVLKLVVVWLLQLTTNDRLIFYSILVFAISLLIRLIYRIYCLRHFPESHLSFFWRPQTLRKMLSFTGWNLYYDASETIRLQGVNILINRFYGVVLNASFGLASMIQGTCWILGNNITAAFRPQIIKQYAANHFSRLQRLMNQALKFTLVVVSLFYIPAIVEMPYLIQLWLGYMPPYLVVFCRIYLLDTIIGLINHIFQIGIHAQGDIKFISIISGTIKFLCLPVIYFLFHNSFSPAWAYWCNLFSLALIVVADVYVLKMNLAQIQIKSLLSTCLTSFLIIAFSSFFYIFFRATLPLGAPYKLLSALLFVALCSFLSYRFLLDSSEKRGFRMFLGEKLRSIKVF